MEIRDLRKRTGLTQEAFADWYHIPLPTLKQWEAGAGNKNHRRPPEHVFFMLERLVSQDFAVQIDSALSRTENLELAAKHSEGSLKQWMRYLGKELEDQKEKFSPGQIAYLEKGSTLSRIQKVIFKRAIKDGTATNKYARSLGMRRETLMVDNLVKGKKNEYVK